VGIGAKGVLSYLVIFLPNFFISPGLLQKLYGARDASAVRWGVGAQALGLLAYAPLPAILGMVAHAAYPGLLNSELALPTVLKEMLPWWMGALLLGAVFSAELSASDAILFSLSTSLSKDLYKGYLNPAASEENLLRVSRFAALAAGLAGIVLAMLLPSVVSALTVFYGLLTVVLLVPLLSGLYFRFPTATAAMITMVAGGTVAGAAHLLTDGKGVGLLNPVALGSLAAAAVMGVFGVIHHAK
jgi:SSS family solute:Na+ symporter